MKQCVKNQAIILEMWHQTEDIDSTESLVEFGEFIFGLQRYSHLEKHLIGHEFKRVTVGYFNIV